MKFQSLAKIVLIAAMAVLAMGTADPAFAKRTKNSSSGENKKYAAIVIDAETGRILHQDNADKSLHPASLTKIMTVLLTFDAIESGRLSFDSRLTVSRHAASQSPSKLGLKAGSSIKVKDALYAVLTKSANDMAVVLAEGVAGSEGGFARKMNLKAQDIGMMRTHFVNASGLHNSAQVSSARDMARLAKYILDYYPRYYKMFSVRNFYYGGRKYHNHNRLMESYQGMDGFKTGYTIPSGFNLVASAKRNNKRIIGVVFGGKTASSRNTHMASLLDKAFDDIYDIRSASAESIAPPPQPKQLSAKAEPQPQLQAQAQPQAVMHPLNPADNAVPEQMAAAAPVVTTTVATTAPSPAQAEMQVASAIAPTPADVKMAEAGADSPAPVTQAAATVNVPQYNAPKHKPAHLRAAGKNVVSVAAAPPIVATRKVSGNTSQSLGTIRLASLNPTTTQTMAAPVQAASMEERGSWSIQIGAYESRLATDQALYQALKVLPAPLNNASAVIVPLRTASSAWMFRARLSGYSQAGAAKACAYFKDCLTISPQAAD